MNSLWNDADAAALGGNPLLLRTYTSRLLGQEPSLVLHGGGNTSVKAKWTNVFGEVEDILYIKGSGWDLASIQPAGFAPVRLDALRRMAELPALGDSAMVRAQRAAMPDAAAPMPSVEAILHALIPFTYVDHTHADAVVAVTNTPDGEARIRAIYGDRVLVVPYVMPGFALARAVFEQTRGVDWSAVEGMVLLHHGVFTWGPDARSSYERMIALVSKAEDEVAAQGRDDNSANVVPTDGRDLIFMATLRREIARTACMPMIVQFDDSPLARAFASLPNVADVATRGPLTPDHVIRTKPVPLILGDDPERDVAAYAARYEEYFVRHASDSDLRRLDPAPRWLVWPGRGMLAAGATAKDAAIVTDIARHTARAIQWAESLGGWTALPERDVFAMEYWELEQAKLRGATALPMQGRVALVTGAASGIGRACAEALSAQGAAVMALDIDPRVEQTFATPALVGMPCDVTDTDAVGRAVDATVKRFGGLDMLVSNAGLFTSSQTLEQMSADVWQRSLELNLTSHQRLLQRCIPYLRLGVDPAVVLIASKNVPAPGPGAGAYSVAKAGLTQLGRVAALELAKDGIRVNMLHPHAVFDTGAWTPEVLASRAKAYGMTVEQYKANNLLGIEVTSRDVAALACAMLGPAFRVTTGAQVAVDGGNDRVI